MRARYINLDAAVERRGQVEASFGRAPHGGWELTRFPAVGAADMAQAPGRLQPSEKACFESHRRLIGQHLDDDAPLLVLEDDVAFSSLTFPVLDAMLGGPEDWDLLFTDVAIFEPAQILEFVRARELQARDQEVVTASLNGMGFVAATAYLIRGSSKAKLYKLLVEAGELDLPYDVHLQQLCARGELKAAVCVPFITTLSDHAGRSQIRDELPASHQALNLFRRLMFIERDPAACVEAARVLQAQLPAPEFALGAVVGALSLP